MPSYKGIKFSKDLNCSLESFKEMFASNRFFKEVPHKQRDAELKKVWQEVIRENGFNKPTAKKSKKQAETKPSKEGAI